LNTFRDAVDVDEAEKKVLRVTQGIIVRIENGSIKMS
jgi:hypothetical protein